MRLARAECRAHPHSGLHTLLPATQQLLLFLIQLNSNLSHVYCIKIWSLKEAIDTMNPAHHVAALFFKINIACWIALLHFLNLSNFYMNFIYYVGFYIFCL